MEKQILKIHQHKIKMILKTLKYFLFLGPIFGGLTFIFSNSLPITFLSFFITFIIIYSYNYFFWNKSYFLVTTDSLSINVRNGFFSQYDMRIHFNQIKDMAYSKNNFLHYLFNYGIMFVRSSAAADGSFIVDDIPNIEEIYKKVSYMHSIGEKGREKLSENIDYKIKVTKSKDELISEVKTILSNIKGIKEFYILDNNDKKYIFENEEDKNHGVYESIKREITFVVSHDEDFRNADQPIVLKLGDKVIFPPVSFHEINQKNTVSSSPGIKIHNYLSPKFKNLGTYDATLLIGFDIN